MPGALAPDPRPVDTDLLHCFSSPWSAAHPVGPMAHGLPRGRGRPGHAGRAGFLDAGVTSPAGRPAAAGHPRRRRRRTGRRRRRQAEPGRPAGSTAPCAPGGHGRQPRPPPAPRREHDKSGNLATPASQPSSLPSCVIWLQPGPVGPALLGTVRIPACVGRHPKVPAGWNVAARRSVTRRCYRAGRGAVSGDQAHVACAGYGLGAVGRAELAQDVGHVLFDRVERHHQVVGDALV